jgi:hypothetical protein
MKRKLVLNCSGCHQLDERHMLKEGRARTAPEWAAMRVRPRA